MTQQSHLAPLSQRPYVASLKYLSQELTSDACLRCNQLELVTGARRTEPRAQAHSSRPTAHAPPNRR